MRVVYIDKEVHNLRAFTASFRVHKEFKIHACSTDGEVVAIINSEYVNVLIIDQHEANAIGIEFLRNSIGKDAGLLIIIVTAHKEVSLLEDAYKEGKIFAYYQKPFDWEQIIEILKNSVKNEEQRC